MAFGEKLAHEAARSGTRSRGEAAYDRRRANDGQSGNLAWRTPGLPFRSAGIAADDAIAGWLLTGFEALAITLSGLVSGIAWSLTVNGYEGDPAKFFGNSVLVAALFSGAMRARDATRGGRPRGEYDALRELLFVWTAVFLFVGFVWFFLKLDLTFSRGALISFFVLGFFAVGTARTRAPELIAAYYHPRRLAGLRVILVGAAGQPAIEGLAGEFRFTGCDDIATVTLPAACDEEEWPARLAEALQRVQLSARIAGHGQICVAATGFSQARLAALLTKLQVIPCAIRIVPESNVERYLHLPTKTLGRLRAIEIQRAPLNSAQRVAKRAIDLLVGIPVLLLVAPLMVAIALWVKCDSKGPVLFSQRRLGYRGREFNIYKFRTMTVQENGEQVTQASKGDLRVTRSGRVLRKLSLDELPQLYNVIKGEMSLVGPRPHAVVHDRLFANLIGNYELRQHVKPGVTGWAQVHGLRGETATTEAMRARVECDLWYARNASIALDIEILVRTFFEVLRHRNAY